MKIDSMSYIHLSEIILERFETLESFCISMCEKEGGFLPLPSDQVQIYEIHNFNGFSGYNYWINNEMVGQLHIASLKNGEYCIYKKVFFEQELNETYSYYDKLGKFTHESDMFSSPIKHYENIQMDSTSPIVNHIYNVLHVEYKETLAATANSERIFILENLLNSLLKNKKCMIGANSYRNDEVYKNTKKTVLRFESNKVLRWNERQEVFKDLLAKRKVILETKKRAHRFSYVSYILPFIFSNFLLKLELIKRRPVNNMKGLFYKYTVGKLIWFLSTVKDNLGYSIALAIYGPFTFYFITQPMNPHAMWLVGEVREAYIQTTDTIDNFIDKDQKSKAIKNKKEDSVSTQLAATSKNPKWLQRMSNFKAMHIAHESNLIFSERMGRLEQIETQLNFPLAVEAAWNEVTRYKRAINLTVNYSANLDRDYKSFLNGELKRAKDAQVYLWERMGQFFIDYPYILVDESLEQTQKNAYTGRAFVFMQKMTDTLAKDKTLIKVDTHNRVKSLANFYKKTKIKGTGILDSLQKNSKLFAHNDLFNTDQFRSYMKRHWEILFLQQNKKQEAASFGMQAYSASIRNAVWSIQSLYSAKKDDHMILSYKFNLDNQNTEKSMPFADTTEMIENILHFITFDYVSIKKEFSNNLKNDKEAYLRERLINNIKTYVSQRDSLLKKQNFILKEKVTGTKSI